MDKLKYIKLENEDGSYSNNIPLAVDANYVDVNGDSLGNKLNTLATKTEMQAIASGSPAGIYDTVATLTSHNPDHSRIYIVVENGHWYYYSNGWQDGGVYQSIGLNNKSIHYENFDDELQNSIESVVEATNITNVISGLVNVDGTITSSTGLQYYEFDVEPFNTYKIHMRYAASTFSNDKVAIQFLNNSTVISNILKTDVDIDENNYYTKVITIPYNVNKVRINTHKYINPSFEGNYILKINKYEVNNIKKYQLDLTLQSFFKNQYEEITPTVAYPQVFFTTSTFSAYATTEILSVDVKPHEVYRINAVQVDRNPLVGFLTNNMLTTKELNDVLYTFNNFVDTICYPEDTRHVYQDYIFEIPDYCEKIYINHWTNSLDTIFKLEKCTNYKINESSIIEDVEKIRFKKLIMIGDSITEVNYRALHNYLYWIKQDIPSLTIQNLGVSGTGYMKTSNTFINRINSINNYSIDDDIIVVMGSVNDMSFVEESLGQLGDTTTDTLYGSMYQFFNTLFTKFNGVRVGCVSPINWRYATGAKDKLNLYIKALKETCELFNVPFLDIHDKTNLRPENETFRNTYYLADGTGNTGQIDSSGIHPNSEGHKLIYGRIKNFIKQL